MSLGKKEPGRVTEKKERRGNWIRRREARKKNLNIRGTKEPEEVQN